MDTYLNITRGTDVILNDHLLFNGSTFDPNLAVNIEANLVSGLGVRTPLDVSIEDDYLVIAIPWVEGRLLGRYGLEVKGESNGLKWLTYADGLIRYTLGTEPGDHDVTVVSDSYEVTQEVSYRYSDSPLDQVTASVDDAVGTPTVITTYRERKLDLAFHNLKGNGIASIEQTTVSETDEGVNVVTITDDLGNESEVSIRNGRRGGVGPQGIPGESAVFDPETGNISQMQQTTGASITDPMSQKAITDAIDATKNGIDDTYMHMVMEMADAVTPSMGTAESNRSITVTGTNGVVALDPYGSQNSKVCYAKAMIKRGSVVKVTMTANTTGRYLTLGLADENPAEHTYSGSQSLRGLQLTNVIAIPTTDGTTTHYYMVEKDGYLVYGWISTYITSRVWTVYDPTAKVASIDSQLGEIDDVQAGVDHIIHDIIVVPLTVDDADEKIQHQVSSQTASTTGNRYTILFQVQKGWDVAAQSSWGSGLNVAIYNTRYNAIVAASGLLQSFNSGYSTAAISGTTAAVGWLAVTTRKTDNTAITAADLSSFLEALSLTVTKDSGILYDIKELQDAVLDEDNSWLAGKNVAIIGDSISTNGNTGENKNVPEIEITAEDVGVELHAYITYNDVQTRNLSIAGTTYTMSDVGTEVTFTPTAEDVGKLVGTPVNYNQASTTTWWEVLADKLNFNPIPVCWSGSSITSHNKNSNEWKAAHAWHESQIRKCGIRTPGTMTRTAPDVIIIYRGTNDMSSDTHKPHSKLTENFFKGLFTIPSDDFISSGRYGFKEGYALTIKKLREAYPLAVIILCTLNVFKRDNKDAWPVNNGVNTLPEFNDAIREVADAMGCGVIEFDKDGITFENCYPTYISDSATIPTHPNDRGHKRMAEKAMADLMNYIAKIS